MQPIVRVARQRNDRRASNCRGSIRVEQVALTQGPQIAAGEPSQSVPRLTRVRISRSAFVVSYRSRCPRLQKEREQSTHERKPLVSPYRRAIDTGRAATRGRAKLKARSIDSHRFFFRALTRSRAPAEDDAENVREAHLQRPIRSVRWRRNGKYMPLFQQDPAIPSLLRSLSFIVLSCHEHPCDTRPLLCRLRPPSFPLDRPRKYSIYSLSDRLSRFITHVST